jgi:hypothetical protein
MTASTTRRIHLVALALLLALASTIASAQEDPYVARDRERIRQACILANCDTPQNRPSAPPGIWGALAFSKSTLVSGIAWSYPSEPAARQNAASECSIAMNAMRDCSVLGAFANGCAALATSPDDHAWGFSGSLATAAAAKEAAVDWCIKSGGRACGITQAFCSPGGQSRARDRWGAIAVSTSTFGAGYSTEADTRRGAEDSALRECAGVGKGDCKVVALTSNASCLAVATSAPEHVQAASKPARALGAAQAAAVASCRSRGGQHCEVVASLCADGRKR